MSKEDSITVPDSVMNLDSSTSEDGMAGYGPLPLGQLCESANPFDPWMLWRQGGCLFLSDVCDLYPLH